MTSFPRFHRIVSVPSAALAMALTAAVPTASSAQPSGDIVIAMPQLSQAFDPIPLVGMTPHLSFVFIYDGLLNLGPKGKVPALAERWQVSPDGKQIDFSLRRGVKFHNGDDFSAEDVKFTFERIMQPDSGHAYRRGFVDAIERIEVVDPATVRFVLKAPWLSFFTTARYALTPIVPKKYYESVGPKGFLDKPIGTGPFRLAGAKAGEWTRYEAFEGYWGGAPKIRSATQRLVGEPFTRYAMLERGEADIVAGLTGPLLERIRSNPAIKVHMSRYSGTAAILFNKELFPEAADRRVRLAVAHAINRKEIAERVQGGICEPGTGILSPGTFGFLEGLPQVPYDPAKARALLAEAGIKPGHKVSFTVQTESFAAVPNAPQVLEAIAGNLEAVGFTVERRNVDNAAWLKMMRGGKPTGIFYAPSSLPDDGGELINSYYVSFSGWTAKSIQVPEYDAIFAQQLKVPDLEQRRALLQRFAKLESENFESAPLLWCHTPIAVNAKRIRSLEPAIGSGYHMGFATLELVK